MLVRVLVLLLAPLALCKPQASNGTFIRTNNFRGLFAKDDSSCVGRCGDAFDNSMPCQCNTACFSHSDCCQDYLDVCGQQKETCEGRCGNAFDNSQPCQCNDACQSHNDCCPDFQDLCGSSSSVTVADLEALVTEMLMVDKDTVGNLIRLNPGGTTSVGNGQDVSPDKLFEFVDPSILEKDIYKKLNALLDNYVKEVNVDEDHTPAEEAEEWDFLQTVMETEMMQLAYSMLFTKGVFAGSYSEFTDKVYTLWFGQYERGGHLSTSGFEHVFVGEISGSKVGGFHNWFHWYLLEKDDQINHLGYWSEAGFSGQLGTAESLGGGLEGTYLWDGIQKPYGSIFIGTSPSFELAVYTAFLLSKPNEEVTVNVAGVKLSIQTWTQGSGDNLMVGSSYPSFNKAKTV